MTKVVKTTNIARMAQKCINCKSGRPSPPYTNPRELGPRKIVAPEKGHHTPYITLFVEGTYSVISFCEVMRTS